MDAIVRLFTNWRMLAVLFMGFSSGLPLALTTGTMQGWMTDAKVDLATIGRFALVGLPYILKFLWAPLLDSYAPPILGRRRGWGLLTQAALIGSIVLLAFSDPASDLGWFTFLAVLVAFCSASQDIVLDAFRTELLKPEEMGFGAAVYVAGYRVGMIVSGAAALGMADYMPWKTVYLSMAACALIGVVTLLVVPEPAVQVKAKKTLSLRERVVLPFAEFFKRRGAMQIILFVMLYKLPTMMATALTTTFLMRMGFEKLEIGAVSKVFGVIATIVGALVGGALMTKLGTRRSLWIFGLLQAGAGLSFLAVTVLKPETATAIRSGVMAASIIVENFMIGLGVAAISGFMMSVCSKQFTGTQFALLSSLAAVTRVILVSPAGSIAEAIGWPMFFVFSTLLAIPGLWLLRNYDSWEKADVEVVGGGTQIVEAISRSQVYPLGLFLFGLVLISTAFTWPLMGLPDIGAWVGAACLLLAFVTMPQGIRYPPRDTT